MRGVARCRPRMMNLFELSVMYVDRTHVFVSAGSGIWPPVVAAPPDSRDGLTRADHRNTRPAYSPKVLYFAGRPTREGREPMVTAGCGLPLSVKIEAAFESYAGAASLSTTLWRYVAARSAHVIAGLIICRLGVLGSYSATERSVIHLNPKLSNSRSRCSVAP